MATTVRLLSKYKISGIEYGPGKLVTLDDTTATSLVAKGIADSAAAAITQAGVEGNAAVDPLVAASNASQAWEKNQLISNFGNFSAFLADGGYAAYKDQFVEISGRIYFCDGVSLFPLGSVSSLPLPSGHQQSSLPLTTVSALSQMVREWFLPQVGCNAIEVLYDNTSAGDIVVTCALEYPAGTYNQLVFEDGGSSATIKPNAIAKTRIAQFYHPGPAVAGAPTSSDVAYIRTFVTSAGSTIPSRGAADYTAAQIPSVRDIWLNGGTDQTLTNDTGLTIANGYIYSPAAILLTNLSYAGKVFAGIGDSIINGQGDIPLTYGWFQRAMFNKAAPLVRDGRPGRAIADFTNATGAIKHEGLTRILGATDVVIQVGTNDISNGTSFSTMQQRYTTLIACLKSMNVRRIYAATTPPKTTSTDSWATTVNQTINGAGFAAGASSVRGQFNAWLRTLPSGVYKCIDVASICETSLDSGIWVPTYTADGIHPTAACYALIGAMASSLIEA